ncbi:MAG TPA: YbhB/YbcL family Raf kinase inhibitor-like protein [Candidatus Babeliales bacterium]|nr:YbhB/YbcL family Raf kinase inhibitor-like protein [Candidatus Babeliales bacterium]
MQTVTITSTAFTNGSAIPMEHTCEGANFSPPLSFLGIPSQAKSLVLIVEDPDAPKGTFTHWIVYNLPPSVRTLDHKANIKELGGLEGVTSFNKKGWGGPCPPSGIHRYFFKLFVLDSMLNVEDESTHGIYAAMEGHVIAQGQLMGTYKLVKD